MKRLVIVLVTLLSSLACEKAPVNPEVPTFKHRPDGSVYDVGADGCEYDLKDNGTFVKHDPSCVGK